MRISRESAELMQEVVSLQLRPAKITTAVNGISKDGINISTAIATANVANDYASMLIPAAKSLLGKVAVALNAASFTNNSMDILNDLEQGKKVDDSKIISLASDMVGIVASGTAAVLVASGSVVAAPVVLTVGAVVATALSLYSITQKEGDSEIYDKSVELLNQLQENIATLSVETQELIQYAVTHIDSMMQDSEKFIEELENKAREIHSELKEDVKHAVALVTTQVDVLANDIQTVTHEITDDVIEWSENTKAEVLNQIHFVVNEANQLGEDINEFIDESQQKFEVLSSEVQKDVVSKMTEVKDELVQWKEDSINYVQEVQDSVSNEYENIKEELQQKANSVVNEAMELKVELEAYAQNVGQTVHELQEKAEDNFMQMKEEAHDYLNGVLNGLEKMNGALLNESKEENHQEVSVRMQ